MADELLAYIRERDDERRKWIRFSIVVVIAVLLTALGVWRVKIAIDHNNSDRRACTEIGVGCETPWFETE